MTLLQGRRDLAEYVGGPYRNGIESHTSQICMFDWPVQRALGQHGSPLVLGTRSPQFESGMPDHFQNPYRLVVRTPITESLET